MDLRSNLQLIYRVRWVVLVVQFFTVVLIKKYLDLDYSLAPTIIVAISFFTLNLLTWIFLKTKKGVTDKNIFIQLFADICLMFILIYCYGGKENPFSFMLSFQVIIAATILRPKWTWSLSALCIALYSYLFLISNNSAGTSPHLHHQASSMNWHLYGMLISFIVLVILISSFVSRLAVNLKKQTELTMEGEDLLALGHFATSAAHQLGTPLATMAIIVNDLSSQSSIEDFKILKNEIARCKNILASITTNAGVSRVEGGEVLGAYQYFDDLFDRWSQGKKISLDRILNDDLKKIVIKNDRGLSQALTCLLDNAFDATADGITVEIKLQRELMIIIQDTGDGFPEEILVASSTLGNSTKPEGFGMGLFLARSVIHRLQGSMYLNNTEKGARVLLAIPCKEIFA